MARVSNWVTNLARGKKHFCELASWGMGFPGLPGLNIPDKVCMTFRIRQGAQLEVELTAEEVDRLSQTIDDFKARNAPKNNAS